MDIPLGSLKSFNRFVPQSDPSVLIIEPNPTRHRSLSEAVLGTMPELVVDACASREHGLSKLRIGRYHAVISDVSLMEADHYSLLQFAQRLPCPVPVLLSAEAGEASAVSRALKQGALGVIRCSSPDVEAIGAVKPALWLYQLRVSLYNRRQRLNALRERQTRRSSAARSERANALLRDTIQDIEQMNELCERTIQQIESSLRTLEDVSLQVEARMREDAMRKVRVLQLEFPSPPQRG
jgi:DNA-binding NtrC family response regulator